MSTFPASDSVAPRKRNRRDPAPDYRPDDPLIVAREGAKETGRALSTFWRDVKVGRLPKPIYVNPRSPRWRLSELRAALSTPIAPVNPDDLSGDR